MSPRDARATGWWNTYGLPLVLVTAFFGLALFLRAYFNYGPSYDGGAFRWSGTDPYYHLRVMEHILATGQFLLFDNLINYPVGAMNPRPPLFAWTTAAAGGLLTPILGGDSVHALRSVAMFAPAIWAALTVIPVYLLGRAAFGRAAGLWAALFVAVLPSHMMRSALGAVDHDPLVMFLITFGAFALVKSLQLLKVRAYVADYRDGAGILPGLRSFFRENQAAVAYAALAGAFWGAVALTWKGYVYIFAILSVWFGIQLLLNHLRRRDNTPYFVIGLIPVVVALVMMWPYYEAVGRVSSAVHPLLYILVGMLVASLVFVPTRHWPAVLVLPATLIAAGLGLVLMLVVFPHIGELFFSGLGYFVQTKLYSTIAEAQRTQLGFLGFSMGLLPLFFGIIALFFLVASVVRRNRDDHLYLLAWGGIGVLMAFTATRFLFEASVPFAVLAGWVTARLVAWVRYGEMRKTWRTFRSAGSGFFRTSRNAVGMRQIAGTFFLVFILLFPMGWLGVDASVPQEYAAQRSAGPDDFWSTKMGAFGQSFLSSDWVDALDYLRDQDPGIPAAERPAFIAWWDYGFYAANRGNLPTVADPFQFGYQISGRFLASQSEAEAILWLTIRLLEGNSIRGETPNALDAGVQAALDERRSGLAAELQPLVHRGRDYDGAYAVLAAVLTTGNETTPDADEVVALYRDVRRETGESVRYFALDGRMFPCDDPRSPGVDSAGIFYAPVYLADKNPEDFVRTVYTDTTGARYTQRVYETTDTGVSRQLEDPFVQDARGDRYLLSGGVLFPVTPAGHIDYDSPLAQSGIQLQSDELEYAPAFYQTVLYRGWVGSEPTSPQDGVPPSDEYAPGQDLRHFRVIYTTVRVPEDDTNVNRCGGLIEGEGITTGYTRGVTLLKYYDGAPVTGTVLDDAGEPMEGVTVRVADNFGIFHDTTTTDAEGRYRLLAPFSTEDDPSELVQAERRFTLRGTGPNQMQVVINGEVVADSAFSVTDDQAMGLGPELAPVDFAIERGNLEGLVFHDEDEDGTFNETAGDYPLQDARVQMDDRETFTSENGTFQFAGIRPGGRSVEVTHDDYLPATAQAAVPSGGTERLEVALRPAPTEVTGRLLHNGEPVGGVSFVFGHEGERPDVPASSNETGAFSVSLARGTWNVTVDEEIFEDGEFVRYFTAQPVMITVRHGDPAQTLDIALEREVQDGDEPTE